MLSKEEKHLSNVDKELEKIIQIVPRPEIISTQNVFHDLMSCILEQQIHYRSTKKTFLKMLQKAELEELTLENFDQFEENAFQMIKLSARKYETISNIITYFSDNEHYWQELTDEEVRNHLSSIKGVGKWTIDMILIYTLQRPNIFSYDDYHIKKLMTTLYGLNPKSRLKAQMQEVAKDWQPCQSTAFLYLLGWKNFQKKRLRNEI